MARRPLARQSTWTDERPRTRPRHGSQIDPICTGSR